MKVRCTTCSMGLGLFLDAKCRSITRDGQTFGKGACTVDLWNIEGTKCDHSERSPVLTSVNLPGA